MLTRIALDKQGAAYIGGLYQTPDRILAAVLIKYAPAGDLQWQQTLPQQPTDGQNRLVDLAVRNDAAYLLVQTSRGLDHAATLALVKYDSLGRLLWRKEYPWKYSSLHKMRLDRDNAIYVLAAGGEHAEYIVAKFSENEGIAQDTAPAKPVIDKPQSTDQGNVTPMDKNRQTRITLSSEERAYRNRMTKWMKAFFERFQSEGQVPLQLADFVIPEDAFQSDIYRKWGLGEKREFSPFEAYYIMQLPTLAETWQMYEAIDLKNLTREEQRFLDDMHAKYGKGKINYRREAAKEKGTLDQHQQDWFDLIKAATGSDTLDDKALIFLHRMTPR